MHLEGLFAIEIGLQAGRDLASQATEASKALQLGVIGHSRSHDELARARAVSSPL